MTKPKTPGEILRDALLADDKDDSKLARDLGAAFRQQAPGVAVTGVAVNGEREVFDADAYDQA